MNLNCIINISLLVGYISISVKHQFKQVTNLSKPYDLPHIDVRSCVTRPIRMRNTKEMKEMKNYGSLHTGNKGKTVTLKRWMK